MTTKHKQGEAEGLEPPEQAEPAAVPTAIPADGQVDAIAAAEADLARLEDRIGAFTSYTLAADFLELRQLLGGTFERMKEEDWTRRTERRPEAWTRRQVLAHLHAVTAVYNTSVEMGLEGRPLEVPGMSTRADLKAANEAAIAERAELPIAELIAAFLAELERGARLAAPLDSESLRRLVQTPYFGAAPTIAEIFGAALAHTGIIHGAQIAMSRSRPLWIYFHPGLMRRMVTRFIHTFGLAYWPERGGDLHATVSFEILGAGGGSWFVRMDPEGGHGAIGVARTSDVRFTFSSAERFCQLMTFQRPIWRALLMRQLRVKGHLRLARRLPHLFMPT